MMQKVAKHFHTAGISLLMEHFITYQIASTRCSKGNDQ